MLYFGMGGLCGMGRSPYVNIAAIGRVLASVPAISLADSLGAGSWSGRRMSFLALMIAVEGSEA
ncbi:hypothetical protein M7I_6738 [Glarea lozoyensis 74030]|uniref:Uncharacterized protein n=1 Tax=Glarea lozoyensis (strain ATCC 74030 / MF5533) TaxID=1104152 RepID=H0EVE0_GLAL7|nr:hypothetical protein M7I_6738 [Glarea lozoyensis 74030]